MKNTYLAIGTMSMMLTLTGCFEQKLAPGALGTDTGGTTGTAQGTWDLRLTFPGVGSYDGISNAPTSAQLCTSASGGQNIAGVIGTAICQSGAPTDLAAVGNVLAGKEYWDTTGALQTGTMTNQGAWDLTTTFPGAGYFSGVSGVPSSTDIKSGATILGVAGNSNVVNTSTGDAVAGEMVSGKKAWVDGSEITGSATDHGAINLNTTAIPGSSAGFYSSIALTISASSVCTGTSIFGSTGTAVCNSVFGDLTASNMHRNVATAQMTLTTEKASGSYDSGYREIPKILKDDDGIWAAEQGCTSAGGPTQTCSTVVKATPPTVDCGASGSIATRIADCASGGKNGANATWSGATKGLAGEATWKLVTRKNGLETWRDERTGLLWSDYMPTDTYNWCYASGSSGGGPQGENDPSDICDDPGNQNQTTPYSVCAEGAGFQSPDGEDYAGGTSYADAKGGMGALSATAVRWRLPTKTDYMQADIDGIRFVLPHRTEGNRWTWTSTVYSRDREFAWYIDTGFSLGTFGIDERWDGTTGTDPNNYMSVRCVGR